MATIRRVTVALFFLLCLLPALQMATSALPELAVDEQRSLAPPPDPADPLRLPRGGNAWFSDHFGLRSTLIRLKAQLDYSVFGMSDRVLIGPDGYLWYRDVVENQRPRADAYLREHQADVVEGMRRYAAALHEAGIDMVVTVNLLGDRFLPEKLPADHASRPVPDAIDGLIRALAAVPELHFVDSTPILRRTMAERPIFHRTDFHWNDPAAFPVAQAIVAEMSRVEGRPATVWRHPLRTYTRQFSGGVARFMPVLSPPTETGLFAEENWVWPPGLQVSTTEPPFELVTRSAPGAPDLLRPTVLLGDSFLDGIWRAGPGAYFSETHRVRWRPISEWKISELTAAIPPGTRWVLVQFIEINHTVMRAFADLADIDRAVALLAARPRPAAVPTPTADAAPSGR